MKKVFSIFLVFATFFLVSCGGLLEEDSDNTVRITMGNARSISASGASDVNYYNIVIQNQTFSNVRPGSTVESSPLPVGMSISISVEAIGNITTSTSGGQSGGAVGTTNKTVVSNGRIAYYQTSERLPAEGLTLNVNMANYKTEYHKVTLEAGDFDRVSEEVYVADGSSYTLPNYRTYTPTTGANGGVPLKHTGWKMYGTGSDTPPVYPVGASVTITGDRQFELQKEDFATITFDLSTYSNLQSMITGYKQTDYAEKNTRYTPPNYGSVTDTSTPTPKYYNHVGWKFFSTAVLNGEEIALNQSVTITEDARFEPIFSNRIELSVNSATINAASSSSITDEGGSYYIWTHQPFILPRGTKDDSNEVQTWYCGYGTDLEGSPGQSLSYDDWKRAVCNNSLTITATN